ncbi:MAG TPA: DUF2142 domain-containing protein, partial [Gemmatales bacterium]|nr:DUF2142 domain-containing protein [Gemmatales bacterium]
MDQTQKIWYRRHSALLGLLVLGLATWFHTYWLPAPATRWQRDTTQLLKTDAIQLSGAQAQQDGQVTTQKHGATITWPAGQVHGVLQFQIAVHWSSQAVPVILQYCTEDYPYFDDDLIHTRSHRPVVEQNGSVQRLTWFLPDAAWSVRLLIPAQVDFRLEQAQAEGVAAEQIYWHTWRQAVIIGLYVVMLLLGLMELSRYLPVLAVLIRSPLGLLLASLLITGLVMILFLPPFQGPDENRHWKTAMELFRRDGQRGSILEKLPAILNAEAPRLRSERRFEAGRLFMNTPSAVGWQEDIKVPYTRHWGYPIIGLVALLFPPVTTVSEAIVFYYLCRCMNLLCLLLLVAYAWKLRVGSITLVMFLMLPLVIQQCVVISTDTAHNLGTLLALLLWMEHRRQKAWWSLLGLVIVSFLVLAAKPPIYLGILLLPA